MAVERASWNVGEFESGPVERSCRRRSAVKNSARILLGSSSDMFDVDIGWCLLTGEVEGGGVLIGNEARELALLSQPRLTLNASPSHTQTP